MKVGQNIQLPNVAGLSVVKKVYPDGRFDADQNVVPDSRKLLWSLGRPRDSELIRERDVDDIAAA